MHWHKQTDYFFGRFGESFYEQPFTLNYASRLIYTISTKVTISILVVNKYRPKEKFDKNRHYGIYPDLLIVNKNLRKRLYNDPYY